MKCGTKKLCQIPPWKDELQPFCNSCGAPYHPAVALQHPAAPMEAPSLERTLTGSTGASAETEARLQGLVRDLFHLADVDSNGTIQFLRQHVR